MWLQKGKKLEEEAESEEAKEARLRKAAEDEAKVRCNVIRFKATDLP